MLTVPSQHASDTPLTLAQCSRMLMILILLQPTQDETMIPPPISALTTPALPSPLLTILMLPLRPQDMPPMPPSTPPILNPLSATYHPYNKVLDP
ncbi:hypothetical protein O181_100081 [Austropuccinia psidii MF-1]|uniref:Uncharacterized protein n=1 Tax=Austropuccinia psidii MF-1 TaxID=1389203 RepID=A0A9Q3JE35_9BASI|nr:hypothetical protein [Austropuccinia psidii MF-1]